MSRDTFFWILLREVRMLQSLSSRWPFIGVQLQHLFQKVKSLLGHHWENLAHVLGIFDRELHEIWQLHSLWPVVVGHSTPEREDLLQLVNLTLAREKHLSDV